MADGIYILTLQLTKGITKVLKENEEKIIETASFFICICYGVWFLKSSLTAKAPVNDLEAFKEVAEISKIHQELGSALKESLDRHTWYLTELNSCPCLPWLMMMSMNR